MTAKPQPMAGQSDAADDLIAELAKLMAQDAQGERPAQPAVPAFSVRIPGGEPDKAAVPNVNVDTSRASAPPAAAKPEPTAIALELKQNTPEPTEPEPFNFDFGLSEPKREVERPAAPIVSSTPAPSAPASPEPAAKADHDSIADLIAAELSSEPTSSSDMPPADEPVVTPEPRPAPVHTAGWTPTSVATNLGGGERQPRPALRTISLQPTQRSDQDRFKVPPVFGLGTTPGPTPASEPVAQPNSAPVSPAIAQPTQTARPQATPVFPQAASNPVIAPAAPEAPASDALGLDPIDEIESLIGRAMRVEFDRPADAEKPVAAERPAPSPALRSLATPIAPATPVAPAQSSPHALSAADEAIFAAAQASGAQVGWVEAPEVSEPEPFPQKRPQRAPRTLGMTRALAGPLVAVVLLLAAGFGLYWVLGLGRDSGPAPLLTADATPVKETPAAQPEAAAAQQSVVFNEMDGVVPGAEEQLVSRDQADVNEVTQVATPDLSEEGLANRKVRTVTVRPDGTIVSGDESVAGNAILPVDRPVVPAVPGAETASPELVAAVEPTPVPAPVASVTPEPAVTPVQPGSTVPAFDTSGNPIAGKTAVVPRLRPTTFAQQAIAPAAASPVNALVEPSPAAAAPVSAELQQPAAQPAAVPAGATEVDALPNNAPAYVQLASQRSEAEARATASAMVSRFGPLFGGANMEVQRVDLGAKGIYYRVRVPAGSMQEANTMCTNVKAAGGDCFTM
ncbi:SPOR domain-containing protein [Devosia lacusdianchii]|uniref:SPOR domain-containing protein n=1 Tax=Devosia lacusdianchii TaxID=2917991 RepID=UPI001F0532CD|nr:SPOR domain-containing protein [Devosia sp. JXJ CY 41]